jgi:Peptidase U49
LALCGVAWSLHHELAHIGYGDLPNAADSIRQERRADRQATAWLLEQAPPGIPVIKRALGIATGAIALARFELAQKRMPSIRTHPHPAERIFNALDHGPLKDDSVGHLVAALLLGCVLQEAKLDIPPQEFVTAKDCIADYCAVLSRGLA